MGEKSRGYLMVIGGGEDRQGDCVVLKEVVARAGGKDGYLIILPTASRQALSAGEEYRRIFKRLGLGQVAVLPIETRKAAQSQKTAAMLKEATAVFFTGGDQLRITSILGGTRCWGALHKAHQQGTLMVGTSAGASVMSDTMIVAGRDDETPVKCTVKMAPGLGFLEEVVIDQHFAQRGRVGRLLMAIAQNPFVIGLGIDEDTAVLIDERGVMKVIGSQTVVVIDGMESTYSNVSEARAEEPLVFTGVILHILAAGCCFHLPQRRFINLEELKEE